MIRLWLGDGSDETATDAAAGNPDPRSPPASVIEPALDDPYRSTPTAPSSTDLVLGDRLEVSDQVSGRLEGQRDAGILAGRPPIEASQEQQQDRLENVRRLGIDRIAQAPDQSPFEQCTLDRPAQSLAVTSDQELDRFPLVVLQPLYQLRETRLGHDFG